jgi:hypothetical protein
LTAGARGLGDADGAATLPVLQLFAAMSPPALANDSLMVHDSTLAALEPLAETLAAVPETTPTATAKPTATAAATESSTRLNPFYFFLNMFLFLLLVISCKSQEI